jgi:CRP/FNR family transcriptional regulator, cyclic AMP receptor protein
MSRAELQRKLMDLTRQATGRGDGRTGRSAPDADLARKIGYLLETEVFAPLSGSERQWLMDSTTMVSCGKGRVFYTPDEPGEVVFILKRGRVALYRIDPEGRKLVVATLGPHTIFGEMGLLGQAMYGCFAEATEESLICVLSRDDLQSLVRRNPEVGLRLLGEIGGRLRQREDELEALAFRGVPARLAALLLREADGYGVVSGYSHQELAERLGTYRETVSQVLGRFRSQNLVSVEPRRIRLLDRDALADYVER